MSNKMKAKGLLKGLQYISHMFENEKEKEFQIGHPTDVKHVAHIGWDGPSATNSAPSWMNEFKAWGAEVSSAPLGCGAVGTNETRPVKCPSEDLTRRGGSDQLCPSPARELLDIPRTSRRQSASSSGEFPRVKAKPKQPKKSSKGSQSPARELNQERTSSQATDPAFEISSSPARPDIPRKTRRKKPKESTVGGTTRSSSRLKEQSSLTYEAPFSDPGLGSGALAMPKYSDEFGQVTRFESFDSREKKAVSSMS